MQSWLSSDTTLSLSAGASLTKYLRLGYLLTTKLAAPGSEAGESKIKAPREPVRHTVSVTQTAFCLSSQGGGALPGAFHEDTNPIHEVPPSQLSHSQQPVYSAQVPEPSAPEASEWPFSSPGAARAHTSQGPYTRSQNLEPYSCLAGHRVPPLCLLTLL